MGRKIIGVAGKVAGPRGSWRRRWAVLLSLVITVGVAMLIKQTVFAVHATGAFQLDGDASNQTNTSPYPAADDWDNVCFEVAVKPVNEGGLGLTDEQATAKCFKYLESPDEGMPTSGATATSWVEEMNAASSIFTGGGSKDPEFISEWLWKDEANNPPDKDNLIHAYAARYSLTPSTECPSGGAPTCEVLYFGSDRFDNSGDAQQAFWFLQSKVEATQVKAGGGLKFSGEHRPGDVLVISNFSNGGTTSTITVLKWDPPRQVQPPTDPITFTGCYATNKAVDPSNPKKTVDDISCEDKNLRLLAELTGPTAKCTTADANDAACGIVNPELITMPWTFVDKTPTPNDGALNGEFYEAGLNLSTLGLGDECFSSVVAETRSSTSTTATLKDFVVGQLGSCETTLTTTASLNGAGTSIISSETNNGTATSGTDTAVLTIKGVSTWAGTLQFYICGPIASGECTADGVLVTSRTVSNTSIADDFISGLATLTSAGRYCWFARFTPDAATLAKGVVGASHDGTPTSNGNNLECFIVSPVTPSLPTTAGADVTLGTAVTDTATLSGAAKEPGNDGGNESYPTIGATNGAFAGMISFTLKKDDCTTNAVAFTNSSPTTFPINVSVTGNAAYGPISFTPNAPGTYHWIAVYNGPGSGGSAVNNVLPQTYNGDCSDAQESVVVQQIPTTISSGPWTYPNDTATVTSSNASVVLPAGGTVVFKLFGAVNGTNASDACIAGANVTTPGDGGLRYIQTFSNVGGVDTAPRSTTNAANAGTGLPSTGFQITSANFGIYYWRVTYTPPVSSTHTGSVSQCVEYMQVNGSDDPPLPIP